jgi:hypothetical protein
MLISQQQMHFQHFGQSQSGLTSEEKLSCSVQLDNTITSITKGHKPDKAVKRLERKASTHEAFLAFSSSMEIMRINEGAQTHVGGKKTAERNRGLSDKEREGSGQGLGNQLNLVA